MKSLITWIVTAETNIKHGESLDHFDEQAPESWGKDATLFMQAVQRPLPGLAVMICEKVPPQPTK